ncbi:MAG TPA: hypothetical protein VFM51_05545 [Solirubrobacterales bacterium]|nr:hypothetical protein [Solirubrobacterales bacterium]
MASIATAFETSRRRDDLTWSHHVAVAALPEAEQEAWLDRAASEGFSVADLRTELRAALKEGRNAPAVDAELVEDEPAVLHEEAGSQEHDPVVSCPRCGYRLAHRDLA